MANERRGGGFFSGFLIGAGIGAAVALALTREDARDILAGKAKEATNFAKDAAAQWQANANDLYERGRTVVESARSNVGSAVEEATASADRSRDNLQTSAEE